MGRHHGAIGEENIGEEPLVALDQAAFEQGFGEEHESSGKKKAHPRRSGEPGAYTR